VHGVIRRGMQNARIMMMGKLYKLLILKINLIFKNLARHLQ